MPVFSYKTIKSPSEGKYSEKGSSFLAFALPVENEQAVKEQLSAIKKKFFDARHHCFAYVLGFEKDRTRAFDDGEPAHSAGSPILGQIRAKDLTNVLVIVVRYFGGVKLGAGGLISAYKLAARQALDQAVIQDCDVMADITIRYRYENTAEVMRLIKDFDLVIVEQEYKSECRLQVKLKLSQYEKFNEKIEFLSAIKIPIEARTK